MDYITIIYQALFSSIALLILTKLMGYREVSNLSMFDYINGITIGSIAAEMAMNQDGEYLKPLVAMITYAIVVITLSKITQKSITARRLINGKAIVLFLHGEIYDKNLKKAKMEIDELLTECRINGYFDLSQVEAIVLEPNGKLSFLPVTKNKPVTPTDLGIHAPQEEMFANVIVDGRILKYNLKHIGYDKEWLDKQLSIHNIKDINDVFLAICNRQGTFYAYKKTAHVIDEDILG
ncbi:MAG: DUF421 domain-containing protein [Lachnospiraceae bacterium]|nr:DUF421 domain-containing protein [Lachnospiraceae bacterium]